MPGTPAAAATIARTVSGRRPSLMFGIASMNGAGDTPSIMAAFRSSPLSAMTCPACGDPTDGVRGVCPVCGAPRPEAQHGGETSEPAIPPRRTRRGAVRSSLPLFPSRSARRQASSDRLRRLARTKRSSEPTPDPVVAELDFETEGAGPDASGGSRATIGLIRRLVAAVIDAGILLAMDAAVVALTLRAAGLPIDDLAALPLLPLAGFLILLDAGYLAAFLVLAGQTVGELAAGVPVRVAGEAQ
ncbi:MAG: hypothetical protein F4Z04_09285 [Acidobacteria bacterium]|nr:hypothetical protein [Acidobacteriota bacterium]